MELLRRAATTAASLLLLFAVLAPVAPAATTITFDELAGGTELKNQYSAQGVTFQTPFTTPFGSDTGSKPYVLDVGSTAAHSGTKVAGQSMCSSERCELLRFHGQFSEPHKDVIFRVGAQHAAEVTVRIFGKTAFNGTRPLLAEEVVNVPGGEYRTRVAFGRPQYDIVYFQVLDSGGTLAAGSRNGLGFDSITFDDGDPLAGPSFALSSTSLSAGATGAEFKLRAGTTRDVKIDINRYGGSSGSIAFNASDAEEITETLIPSSTTGNQVTLRLTAPDSATPREVSVSVTGSPSSSSAGAGPVTLFFKLIVIPTFTISVGKVVVDHCGRGTAEVDTYVPEPLTVPQAPGFDGDVMLSATGGPDASVKLTPDYVKVPSTDAVRSKLSIELPSPDPVESRTIEVLARSWGFADARHAAPLSHTSEPLTFSSISPSALKAPRRITEGSGTITIRGSGFCPGLRVYLGNSHARWLTREGNVSPDGKTITIVTPRLASTGFVWLVGARNRVSSPAPVSVTSYRSERGYAFPNYKLDDLEFEHTVDLFGEDATYITACVPFTGACLNAPMADPAALNFHAVIDGILAGDPGDAHCFGMSLSSIRFRQGDFPWLAINAAAQTVFDVAPADSTEAEKDRHASPSLDFHLKSLHIAQTSSEAIGAFVGQWGLLHQPASLRTRVKSLLDKGEYPLVSVRRGSFGHTMVVYDVEETDDPGVEYYLRVYDPNRPYDEQSAETGSLFKPEDEKTFGDKHAEDEQSSRIAITDDAHKFWKYAPLKWSGDATEIGVVPRGDIPRKPTMPVVSFSDLISFGSNTEVVSMQDQIGDLQASRPSGQRAFSYPTFDASSGPENTWFVKGNEPYTYSVRGNAPGKYSASVVGRGRVARFEGIDTDGKTPDTFGFDGAGKTLTFATQAEKKALTGTLADVAAGVRAGAATARRAVRTASISIVTSAGGSDSFSFEGESLVLNHEGAPTEVSLKLGWVGPKGTPGTFETPALKVGDGETLSVTPRRWNALDGGRAVVTKRRGGRKSKRVVGDRRRSKAFLRKLSASATKSKSGAARISVRAVATGLSDASTAGGDVVVLRGRKQVTRKRFATTALAGRKVELFSGTVKGLKRGRYRIRVRGVVAKGGVLPEVQRLKRVLKLSVR